MDNTLADTQPAATAPQADAVRERAPRGSLIAAALAALGASACCIVPFALMAVGIGGAWMSYFTVLEPFRPWLIGVTAACVGVAFYRLYMVPRRCEADGVCVDRASLRRGRMVLWMITALLVPVVTFPYYFEYLL